MLRGGMLRQPLILEHVHQRRLTSIIQSLCSGDTICVATETARLQPWRMRTKKRILAFLLYKPSWFNTL